MSCNSLLSMEAIDEIENFAEEVFNFVLNECTHYHSCKNLGNVDDHSNFSSSSRIAVRYYLKVNEEEVQNIFNILLGHGNLNTRFREFTGSITKEMFLRGYSPNEFLEFCAFMSRLAVLCYRNNYRESLPYAIKTIVDVLRLYIKNGDVSFNSWQELNRTV